MHGNTKVKFRIKVIVLNQALTTPRKNTRDQRYAFMLSYPKHQMHKTGHKLLLYLQAKPKAPNK